MAVESETTGKTYLPGSAMAAESLAGIVFHDPDDLRVEHWSAGALAGTLLVRDLDYTITGDGKAGQGSITALAQWGDTDEWRVSRRTRRIQPTRLPAHKPLPSASVELALDRQALVMQEQAEGLDDAKARAVLAVDGEQGLQFKTSDLLDGDILTFKDGMLKRVAREQFAGKFFAGDASGGLVPASGTGADGALRADLATPDGAKLVSAKRDALAMPEVLDIVINRQNFYPQSYGAVADGVTDDAAAINLAIAQAFAARGRVMFEGEYVFGSQLEFSAIMGVKPGSRLICPADFDDSGVGTAQRTAIINKGFALAYDPDTALPIVIEDPLEIVMRAATNHQLLTLANVSRVEMNAPKFWTETTARCDALIDFYACWRNVDLYAPDLANTTGASGGAASWIRNITTDGSNSENDAFGLRWHGGELRHNTGDETLAVYGVLGATHDVTIKDLAVKALDDAATGTRHSTLISCFPLNNGGSASAAQGDLYAAVYNVLFDNLTVEDARFRDHVFRTGRSEDKYNPCHDITLHHSWIRAKQASVRTSHIMRHVPNVGGNVCIDDVTAIGDATGEAITYGALDFDLVTNSDITGNVDRAVARTANPAMAVKRNKRLIGNVYGIDDAVVVEHNEEVSGAAYAVQLRSSLTYRIAASALRVRNTSGTAAGVLVNSIGGAASPTGVIDQITLTANNPSAVLATTSGAIGAVDLLRSRGLGTGFTGLSSAFRAVEGNSRFGSPDPLGRTVAPGDAAANLTSAPYQLVMHDTALTADRAVALPQTGLLDGQIVEYLRLSAAGTSFTTSITGAAGGTVSFNAAGGARFVRVNSAWKRAPALS